MPGSSGACGDYPLSFIVVNCGDNFVERNVASAYWTGRPQAAILLESLVQSRAHRAMKTEQQLREEIVQVGRLMFDKGWIASNDGNISIRLDETRLLATPTGVCKGLMRAEDIIVCDLNGAKLCGERECTSELAMHLTIYRLRPDIASV